ACRWAAEDHQRSLAQREPGLARLGALIDHGEEPDALGADHAGELRHGVGHRVRAELGDHVRLVLDHRLSPQSGRRKSRLVCGPGVDRPGTRFDPQLSGQVGRWYRPAERDLVFRPPWPQGDLGAPDRADENEPLLAAADAPSPDEAEQPRPGHRGARLLQDLPAERLLPRLAGLGTATRPPPALAVLADQDHLALGRDAEGVGSVPLAGGRGGRRMPRQPPVIAVGGRRHLLTVQRDPAERGHAGWARTNSAITAPSRSPASSCRKWPAPSMTGCSSPAAPGTVSFRMGAIAPVIGSRSLNATRNGLSQAASRR